MKKLFTWLLLVTFSFTSSIPTITFAATEDEHFTLHKEIKPTSTDECKEEFETILQVTQKDTQKKIDLGLIIDASGSMSNYFNKAKGRWERAPQNWQMVKDVAKKLVGHLDPTYDRVSATMYQGDKGTKEKPSTNPFYNVKVIHPLNNQLEKAKQAINSLRNGGSTPTASGLKLALEEMESKKRNDAEKLMVLITDGQPNVNLAGYVKWDEAATQTIEQAARIKNAGYKLLVVYIANTSDEREKETSINLLKRASSGSDYFYTTENFGDLETIFKEIQQQIKPSTFQITEKIADEFTIVPGSFTGDNKPTVKGNTLVWDIADIEKATYKFTYKLKRKSPETPPGTYPTTTQSILQYGDTTLNFPPVQATLSGECMRGSITVKYVDEEGNTLKETLVKKDLPLGKYTENAPDIEGYTVIGESSHTFNLTRDNPHQEHTFVYKKIPKKGTVIVKYIDTDDNKLTEDVVLTGDVGSPYKTEQKEFDGYEFVKVEGPPEGTFIDGEIVVTYIYEKIIKGSITVKYEDESGKTLKEPLIKKDLPLGEYTEKAPAIEGYELVNESSHTFKLTKKNPDQEHTFIYKKKKGTVIVKYIDKEGKKLTEDITLTGDVGNPYKTEKKEFDGYEFVKVEGPSEGTFIDGEIVVTYIYEKIIKGSITVHYKDEDGQTLKETLVKKDLPLGEYTEKAPAIEGYELVNEGSHTFHLTKGNPDQEHTFIYKKIPKKGTVTVKYIDEDGNPLSENVVLTGNEGDPYTTEKKEFDGYEFVKVEGPVEGTFTDGNIDVIYIYKKIIKGSITVKYEDTDGNTLKDTLVKKDLSLGEYTETAPAIEGYELVNEKEHTFNLTKDNPDQEHTFIYKKIQKKGTVTVKYIDEDGNPLTENVILTGNEGDPYTTEKKEFDGYEFVKVVGPTEGTFTDGNINVTYIYKKVIKGSITVKYEDEDGNTLKESLVKKDLPLGEYTETAPTIEGYELVSESSHTFHLTKKKPDQKHTFIYKKKKGTVIVRYIDKDGNELHKDIHLTGDVGSPYKTEEKQFPQYVLTDVAGEREGQFIDGMLIVTYIYEKKSSTEIIEKGSITVKYVDEDGNILKETLVKKDLPLDKYTEIAPTINGYTLINEKEYTFNLTKENPDQEHTFIYKKEKKKGTVIVKYVDTDGNKLHDDIHLTGNIGDKYTTDKQEFDGYEFIKIEGQPEGEFIDGEFIVTYIYKPTKKEPIEPGGEKEKPEKPEEKLPQTGEEQPRLPLIGAALVMTAMFLFFRMRNVRNK
ncbi:MucBP domain-containing protein [Priestia taiwanensis]|uniref:Uncharacterized protein n=1 Tax=Priestia taiwanensis TaxID=1347902 RepID=A0A917ESC1_9BACI|nr:MucBP domain-containing protein [Priestia taiwanensis]MBM7365222.1 LPXTG-motif cell wall-anchored protein [Priestia taiwanensis]GGE73588.1 hypothetical protein GCM10007140_24340 [Priestia taiwanensis]